MRARCVYAANLILRESGVTIRRHRTSLTGVAYTSAADWGIEAPPPTTPARFAVLAHEVAHQCLHRGARRPRWREEVEAWAWAIQAMRRFCIPIDDVTDRHVRRGVGYAMAKAERRGVELPPFDDLMAEVYTGIPSLPSLP